jgi:hypothetical protein
MKALILSTTEKETFNGKQLGFVLDSKDEEGQNSVYYPFFQNLVQSEAVGKYLNVETVNGSKNESVTDK